MKKAVFAVVGVLFVAALVFIAPVASHHLLPLSWTGEATRIAEIGAGSGAMAAEIATILGPEGALFATEISAERRRDLQELVKARNLPQIIVVEAKERSTNLESSCCSAVYMRNVLHHIDDWPVFAQDLQRTVRPGGIIAIIDFVPGAMFHLAGDHGAEPGRVVDVFTGAGLRLERRIDDWGGDTYLLAFRRTG
jgi:ubiquinone/menaquinone biosynthesis C-methylase UbiE